MAGHGGLARASYPRGVGSLPLHRDLETFDRRRRRRRRRLPMPPGLLVWQHLRQPNHERTAAGITSLPRLAAPCWLSVASRWGGGLTRPCSAPRSILPPPGGSRLANSCPEPRGPLGTVAVPPSTASLGHPCLQCPQQHHSAFARQADRGLGDAYAPSPAAHAAGPARTRYVCAAPPTVHGSPLLLASPDGSTTWPCYTAVRTAAVFCLGATWRHRRRAQQSLATALHDDAAAGRRGEARRGEALLVRALGPQKAASVSSAHDGATVPSTVGWDSIP